MSREPFVAAAMMAVIDQANSPMDAACGHSAPDLRNLSAEARQATLAGKPLDDDQALAHVRRLPDGKLNATALARQLGPAAIAGSPPARAVGWRGPSSASIWPTPSTQW